AAAVKCGCVVLGPAPNTIDPTAPAPCPDGRDGLRLLGEAPAPPAEIESREKKMAQTFTGRKRVRKFFGTINEVAEMPNLIEVQKASYDQFLLVKEPVGGRPDEGLQ